ncbi:MAG: ABC transporter substrate-binding protein, partial [Candidatus Lokiarchaeota archaeon]|nr:ABC transporter substrate-binding protein [Candidatus Lokiarchaeota archaeon]
MEMEKKNLAIIILAIVLAASGIGNIILGVQLGFIEVEAPDYETFTRAALSGPTIIDPIDCWEQAGSNVIRQVAETLWYYNWTDMGMGRINMLAESQTWINTTALSVTLREGIRFHDNTPFNAEAVKWNIDRILYLCNHTGELTSEERTCTPASLYEDPEGNALIAGFEVTGTFTGIIHLTQPFSSIMDLMCFIAGAMISPTAHAGDEHTFIDLATGDLVGTGPYKYDEYIAEQEVKFSRWDDYWGGPMPHEGLIAHFEKMIFVVIDDPSTHNYAMLAHDVDWIQSPITDLFGTFNDSETIAFVELDNAGIGISYLGFNNIQVNITWRKAMTYAFNYTYMVHEYWQDRVFQSYGWVSPGYGEWYTEEQEL